jgi:hypothetical protein
MKFATLLLSLPAIFGGNLTLTSALVQVVGSPWDWNLQWW